MSSTLSLPGFPSKVSERHDGATVLTNQDQTSYAVVGEARRVEAEAALVNYLSSKGAPVPSVEAVALHPTAHYVMSGLTGFSFSRRFNADIQASGDVQPATLADYQAQVLKFMHAQMAIFRLDHRSDPHVVLDAIHFDELFHKFPDRTEQLQRVRDRLVSAINSLPATLCHGDFGGANLFQDGSIDFEHPFWGPIGYDQISAVTNFLWYPAERGVAERQRPWSLGVEQIQDVIQACERALRDGLGATLEGHMQDLLLMRGCWYLGATRSTNQKLAQWRQDRLAQALDAYSASESLIPALIGTEPSRATKAAICTTFGSNFVYILGAGAATRDHRVPNIEELLPRGLFVCDIDRRKLGPFVDLAATRETLDATEVLPFKVGGRQAASHIAIVATPMKLEPLQRALEAGFRRIIMEKPVANSAGEAQKIRTLLGKYTDAKIFVLESYCTKALPLTYLCAGMPLDDDRCTWLAQAGKAELDQSLHGSFKAKIGPVRSIEAIVFEGGQWGIPDLENIPYLMSDPHSGGMLLGLFPHALHPLISNGLLDPETIRVVSAKMHTLQRAADGKFERAWQPISARGSLEAKAEVELEALSPEDGRPVAVKILVGKTWEPDSWDNWRTLVKGDKGMLDMCTRRGGRTKLFEAGSDKPSAEIFVRDDIYRLGLREARLFFDNRLGGDGRLKDALRVVEIIDRVKAVAWGEVRPASDEEIREALWA
ncbi:MAG: phosphotransferase [Oligoflexia bacterium]|nr:phosphotransferase [Oligoflexia bacterium]